MKPRTRRILKWTCLYPLAVLVLVAALPAPHFGYWHTPMSDCLCDSKNLLKFEDGTAYRWASAHGIVREPFGEFERGIYSMRWHTHDGIVTVTPGWLFIRIKMPDDTPYVDGSVYWGIRELRPSYIREALANQTEHPGTGQPATRPVDKPEGSEKPQPEGEGRRP
jgi:hypothetical protein